MRTVAALRLATVHDHVAGADFLSDFHDGIFGGEAAARARTAVGGMNARSPREGL